jgi:spoIIIJ-associated protein
MEWVETTGKSVEEATERALTHLGVGRNDAEIEVLEEPKTSIFGKAKGEARVKARVRPAGPRPKRTSGRTNRPAGERRPRPDRGPKPEGSARKENESQRPRSDKPRAPREQGNQEERVSTTVPLAEQGAIGKEFLEGLLKSMQITASVSVKEIDSETVEISINHEPPTELGVLVGPRGTTLQALQEVTRTLVQSKVTGRTDRILVDVAQYRERRVAALGRFAQQVAEEVVESGEERALEPMGSADRKAIHDALTDNSNITTRSEGEEPRRFVVIAPA